MKRPSLSLTLLSALLVLAVAAGCGDDSDSSPGVPDGAVALVGTTAITARQARALLPTASTNALARRAAAAYLIAREWLEREARRQGLDELVAAAGRSVPASTGAVPDPVKLMLAGLSSRLAGPMPSRQDIRRYYREHPLEHRAPEVRAIRRLPTTTRAQAMTARQALEDGGDWSGVFDRYADMTTHIPPPKGEIMVSLDDGQENFVKAIFAMRRGTVDGPIRIDDKWYVLELLDIEKLPGQTLAQARASISSTLARRRAVHGQRLLAARMKTQYRPQTLCGRGVSLPECDNRPNGQVLQFGID